MTKLALTTNPAGAENSGNFRRHRVDGGGLRQPGLRADVDRPLRQLASARK